MGAKRFDRVREGMRKGLLLATVYGVMIGLVLIFGGRTLSMLFVDGSKTAVLDAAARYLRCLGSCYWMLGFLNIFRMTTQGLGYAGRAVIAGGIEMLARIMVSLVFVPIYGFAAICWADQAAWATAVLYLMPLCLYLMRRMEREIMMKTDEIS